MSQALSINVTPFFLRPIVEWSPCSSYVLCFRLCVVLCFYVIPVFWAMHHNQRISLSFLQQLIQLFRLLIKLLLRSWRTPQKYLRRSPLHWLKPLPFPCVIRIRASQGKFVENTVIISALVSHSLSLSKNSAFSHGLYIKQRFVMMGLVDRMECPKGACWLRVKVKWAQLRTGSTGSHFLDRFWNGNFILEEFLLPNWFL